MDLISQYLIIEIPEFENREIIGNDIYFKIYGIEKERPLVRINSSLYEGKWFFRKGFLIFTKKDIKLSKLPLRPNHSTFFWGSSKIRKIELGKSLKSSRLGFNYNVCYKKLRLYRIPLIINNKK